mgnify:CR=1 FL=1
MLTEKTTSSELAIRLELKPRTKSGIVGHRTSMFSRVASIKLHRTKGRRVARYDIHGCSLQGLGCRRAEVERKRGTEEENGREQRCPGKGQREEPRKRKREIEGQRGRGRKGQRGRGREKKKREKKKKEKKHKRKKKIQN